MELVLLGKMFTLFVGFVCGYTVNLINSSVNMTWDKFKLNLSNTFRNTATPQETREFNEYLSVLVAFAFVMTLSLFIVFIEA